MKRRTVDLLAVVVGLFLAVTLIVAGGMLTWANTFIGNEVQTLRRRLKDHGTPKRPR